MGLKKKEPPTERFRIQTELDRLEQGIADLKIQFEQFFLAVRPTPPTHLDQEMDRLIRDLQKSPLPQASNKFRLNTLKQRLQTFRTRWERIMRERDEGTFAPDVFKANIRKKSDEPVKTKKPETSDEIKKLYKRYCGLLSEHGKDAEAPTLDAFKKVLMREAKRVQTETGQKRVSFKISIKDGKPEINAGVK